MTETTSTRKASVEAGIRRNAVCYSAQFSEKNEVYINKWLLQPIILIRGRHFVRHLGICKRICVNLLQLMSGVIMHNSVKKTKSP